MIRLIGVLLCAILFCGMRIVVYPTGTAKGIDYTQDADCYAAYTWDEGNDTSSALMDASGNGRVGTYENGAAIAVNTGKWGNGALFENDTDSNDYINITTPGNQTLANYTITCWYKSADTDGTTSQYALRWREAAGSNYFVWMLFNDSDPNLFLHSRYSNASGDNSHQDNRNIVDQAWHHLAIVRDGATTYTYVDGSSTSTAALDTGTIVIDDTEQLFIGNNVTANTEVDGIIDELGLFTRALSSSEINNIMNDGLKGNH